ncbi:TrpB-like pyridoxal phosphate-dependent enzyme [Natranaerofaba carboxydovora]|uniref:TrpB-like pyridoxal phosphate-dependent enzyme n=1 Tax=Natranaerofaba carboxydovora TaxID=2742683 RepID=UPI001F1400BC|nr:TrpB-like pyridoxal phosphate-dependent enzyme [Natranaerofaba carboxydovora]UMZ73796.1 Tryptophan synthase beta chain [Natranaerofaba carboxydovora]
MKEHRIFLPQNEIPTKWYNIQADMPSPMKPPLNPETKEPIKPQDLEAVFPMNLIEQELSTERWIDIPEEVLDKLLLWRPTPLQRAYGLEKYLDTPAKIYFKDEGISPAGSHKPNTAIAQAYYNKEFGIKKLTTETGAGQWGSALSLGCSLFGLECKVYMVRVSYDQKPYRRMLMQLWGGNCIPSPSNETSFGRKILEEDPDCPGSLGMAISEAIEEAVSDDDTRYSLGSVLNHVMLHQTVIGLEAKKQLKSIEEYPDVVVGCVGGGSNFAGIAFPFIKDKIEGTDVTIVGSEPSACPTLSRAPFGYDFGDTAGTTPLLPMHTLGHEFMPPPVHAGGLRYHGSAPLVSQLTEDGLIDARNYNQLQSYQAGVNWARAQGSVVAPETTHALAAVFEEAIKAREEGKEKTILFNLSGHGLMDLTGYDAYLKGNLKDIHLTNEELRKGQETISKYPKP